MSQKKIKNTVVTQSMVKLYNSTKKYYKLKKDVDFEQIKYKDKKP